MADNRRRGANGRKPQGGGAALRTDMFIGLLLGILLVGGLGAYLGMQYQQHLLDRPRVTPPPPPPPLLTTPAASPPATPPTLLTEGTEAVPIIMYHDVVGSKQIWFDMTTREFARQMQELDDAGAHPISIQDLYDHLKSHKAIPDHPILLTFDDCTLGHYTEALPILKKHHFPAVFFVQTASVCVRTEAGNGTHKDHMSWDQLKAAEATGLITVESHTVTHPEDITQISDDALETEMQESRKTLEAHLDHPVRFLAYPSGHCDARVEEATIKAGYLAAVTMDRGWAASPAQSYFLPRFAPPRVRDVLTAWRDARPPEPPLPRQIDVKNTPLEMGTYKDDAATVQWLAGGDLTTQALNTRKTVGEMADQIGAKAALNGTFFADARVASEGSAMIGPILCSVDSNYQPCFFEDETRIEGRPLVLVGKEKCLVLPYTAHLGHSLEVLQSLMPDVKDVFLAGGWIVHNGKAMDPELMKTWSTSDAADPRHRAFVGIDGMKRYILGATQDSVSTGALAAALEKMGIEEAWLMDSGFSTSLIWQNHVLVSGHFHKDVPSRPVPHALFLMGDLAPNAMPPPADSPVASGPGAATTEQALIADGGGGVRPLHTRRHRRKRHSAQATQ